MTRKDYTTAGIILFIIFIIGIVLCFIATSSMLSRIGASIITFSIIIYFLILFVGNDLQTKNLLTKIC